MQYSTLKGLVIGLLLASNSLGQETDASGLQPPVNEAAQAADLERLDFVWAPLRPGPRLWLGAEYLMWWVQQGPAPVPMATSAPATSPSLFPGALGNADTTVLLGGRPVEHPLHHGGRFNARWWLDRDQTVALEGSYFFLADRTVSQAAAGTVAADSPFLVNPFFDVSTGSENANYLGFPGAAAGSDGAAVLTNRSRLQGAECNTLGNLFSSERSRLRLLAGFRFLQRKV